MTKILKDPLIYFLLAGFGLFLLFDVVASDEAAYDSRVINVDRDALLTFVQYRSRAFESEYGMHLGLLARKAADRYPELAEIEVNVREDTEREAIAAQKDKAIQAIVEASSISGLKAIRYGLGILIESLLYRLNKIGIVRNPIYRH